MGFFSGSLCLEELITGENFAFHNKNSLKHYDNSLKPLTLTVHGVIFERDYYYQKDVCV